MRTPDFRGKIRSNMSLHFSPISITTLSDILGAAEDELICQKLLMMKMVPIYTSWQLPISQCASETNNGKMGCFNFLGFLWFSKILTLGGLFYLLGNASMATSTGKNCHVCNQDEAICSHQISFWKELEGRTKYQQREFFQENLEKLDNEVLLKVR